MTYEILQLKNDCNEYHVLAFTPFALLKKNQVKLNLANYKTIYKGNIQKFDDNTLNTIYAKFQGEKPKDYHGHSLSISDIIHINNHYYYIDDFDFQDIKDFNE